MPPDPGEPWVPDAQPPTRRRQPADALRQRRRQLERAARAGVVQRSAESATAGPYDLVAAALLDVVADAVATAILGPDFAAALRARALTIAPVCGQPPEPPVEWMHDGLDLIGADGALVDPLARLQQLWNRAFAAGWTAHAGQTTAGDDPPAPA